MELTSDVAKVKFAHLPSPRVPPELSDLIIDYLHDHKLSLKNCSLVCRAWLPATRYHLFSAVDLFIKDQLYCLRKLIEASQSVDTLPKPTRYMRKLCLALFTTEYLKAAFTPSRFPLPDPQYGGTYRELFLFCFPHLSRVETIRLTNIDFPHLPLHLCRSLTTFSPVIRTINIVLSLIGGPLYCEQIFKSFPQLRMVHVEETDFIFGDTRENLTGGTVRSLSGRDHIEFRIRPDSGHVLHVDELAVDCRSSHTASVICRVRSEKQAGLEGCLYYMEYPPVVEMHGTNHLQLPSQIPAECNKTNMTGMRTLLTGILSKVVQSVEHLSLCFQYVDFAFMDEQMSGFDLGISEMDNLTSLRLGDAQDQDLRWILPVLKHVTSFKLKKLTIVLPTIPLEDLSDEVPHLLQWRQLDDQLVRLRDTSSYFEVDFEVEALVGPGESEADHVQEVTELRSLGISMLPSTKSSGVRITTSVSTCIPIEEDDSDDVW